MSYQPLGDEGAQMEREVQVKQDVLQEKIKYLVQLGLSQGLSSVDFRDLLDMLEIRFIIKHGNYKPGAPEGINAFEGGRADLCRYLKYVCGEISYEERLK